MIQAQFASILPEQVVDQNHGPEQQHLERERKRPGPDITYASLSSKLTYLVADQHVLWVGDPVAVRVRGILLD